MALKVTGKVPQKPTVQDYSEHLGAMEVALPIKATVQVEKKSKNVPWHLESEQDVTVNPGVLMKLLTHVRVGIEGSRTINLGDFNSARIGVTLSVPCSPEDLEPAYNWATEWVSDKITMTVAEATGQKK